MNDVSAFSTEVAAEHRNNCSVHSIDSHSDIKEKIRFSDIGRIADSKRENLPVSMAATASADILSLAVLNKGSSNY